jgi:hypothetical protein
MMGMAAQRVKPQFVETSLTGLGLLGTPIFNKGTAFPASERDEFSLHGLLPPHVGTLDEQVERRLKAFRALRDHRAGAVGGKYTLGVSGKGPFSGQGDCHAGALRLARCPRGSVAYFLPSAAGADGGSGCDRR